MSKSSEVIFFLGLFLLLLLPPFDPDLGWQWRCGELIIKEGGFCGQNQFSSFMSDYHWTNHHWLYQILIYSLWQKFGLWGLTVLNAIIATLIFIVFNLAVENFRLEKMGAIILTLILTWNVFGLGIRSQLLGIFYFSLILLSLLGKIIPKYYLPLIFLLWANTHGSVILGLAFFFLFSLNNFKDNLLIFLLSCLATLINPFGTKIFQEAWQHFAKVPLEKLIAEWVPPQPQKWILILLGGIFLLFLSEKNLWPAILSFTLLALKARRNLPFFFILFFIFLLRNNLFKNWLLFWLKKKSIRHNLAFFLSLVVLFYAFFVRLPKTFKINSSWENYCQASGLSYPYEAVAFLRNQPEKGNLFNRYEWGGFLIWQLPEYKVFVDGRMPAWPTPSGKSPYTIYLETLQTQPGWQETLNRYNIQWILISPGTFMDLKLRPNPEEFGWQEVYRDKKAVVYKRV